MVGTVPYVLRKEEGNSTARYGRYGTYLKISGGLPIGGGMV